jgi:hypothetical protein
MRRASTRYLFSLWICILCIFVSAGCIREYDLERQSAPFQSLGHAVFEVLHKDAQRSPSRAVERTRLLEQEFVAFVTAINTVVPHDQLENVDRFMGNLMVLTDQGFLPGFSRKVALVLEAAARDEAVLNGLASRRTIKSADFLEPSARSNLLGRVSGFSDFPLLLEDVTGVLLDHDGFDASGRKTTAESPWFLDLNREVVTWLRSETDGTGSPLAIRLQEWLLREDDRYGVQGSARSPLMAVAFDERGMPRVASSGDGLVWPFVDADRDGLADLGSPGNFLFRDGGQGVIRPFAYETTLAEPVVRDGVGRASLPDGTEVYQYLDLQETALGFLLTRMFELSSHDTVFDLLQALEVVLGSKVVYQDQWGGYEAFAGEQPLMDLAHSLGFLFDTETLPDALDALALHADREPDALAALVVAVDSMVDVLGRDPSYQMYANQTLVYDLIPILEEITADPVLFSAVLEAFRAPISRKTGEALATMVRYRNRFAIPVPDGPYDACFQECRQSHNIGTESRYQCIRACPNQEIFSLSIDPLLPESEDNRSHFQQFFHLIWNTAGVAYSMEITHAELNGVSLPQLPPLMTLPGAAEAFLASIAGNLYLADYVPAELFASDLGPILDLLGVDSGDVASMLSTLSPLFGSDLDVYARPDQITRLFNQKDLKFQTPSVVIDVADPIDRDGYVMSKHLAYGLFVAEAAGVIDTIHPLAKAFSDGGKEEVLTRFFQIVHDHYASRSDIYLTAAGGLSPMKASNLRSYEPALEQVFAAGELFDALADFSASVDRVESETGVPIRERLRLFLHHSLVHDPALRNRRGESFVVAEDGRTIYDPSPMHLLVESVGRASQRLEPEPELRGRLRAAVGRLVDLMVGAEKDSQGVPRFKHDGSVAFLVQTLRFLSDEAQDELARGTFSSGWWDRVDDVEALWRSRAFPAALGLVDQGLSDPERREVFDSFVAHLLSDHPGQADVLVSGYSLLVESLHADNWRPVSKLLADSLDPDRSWSTTPYSELPLLTMGCEILSRALSLDTDNTGIFVFHRGVSRESTATSAFDTLGDILVAYHSPDPGQPGFGSQEDYRRFLYTATEYIRDERHGIERLYDLVSRRQRLEP